MKQFVSLILITLWLAGCSAPPLSPEANALIKQAEAGNTKAIHKLCHGYQRGKGLPKNYDEAFKWCSKGAEMKIPSSQTLLAEMYYLGLGIDQDYRKAFHWYKMAANLNHSHAQYILATFYLEGKGGVFKKPRKAIYWLQKATSQGHIKAQRKLKEIKDNSIH